MGIWFQKEEMTEILRDFYTLTKLRIVLFDDEFQEIISYPNRHSTYCTILRDSQEVKKACNDCDLQACVRCRKTRKPYMYQCHAGLWETVVPLQYESTVTGYLMFGQVLLEGEETREELWKKVEDQSYDVDHQALKEALPAFPNNPVAECDTMFSEKDGKKVVDFIIYPAKNGDQWVGTAVEAKSMGFGGELKVLVGFDAEGKIYNYSLLSHAETPGLGSKAADWFKEGNKGSIKGMNPGEQPLTVSKDGGQVDAITASTITSRAFLNAVNAAYGAYKGNGDTNGTTGASQKAAPVQESETAIVDSVVIK